MAFPNPPPNPPGPPPHRPDQNIQPELIQYKKVDMPKTLLKGGFHRLREDTHKKVFFLLVGPLKV